MDRFQDQVRAYALQQEIVQLQRVQQKLDERIRHAVAHWLQLQPPQELPVSTVATAAERLAAEEQNLRAAGLAPVSVMSAGELYQLTVENGHMTTRFLKSLEIWKSRTSSAEVLVLKTLNEAGGLLDYQTFVSSASVAALKP